MSILINLKKLDLRFAFIRFEVLKAIKLIVEIITKWCATINGILFQYARLTIWYKRLKYEFFLRQAQIYNPRSLFLLICILLKEKKFKRDKIEGREKTIEEVIYILYKIFNVVSKKGNKLILTIIKSLQLLSLQGYAKTQYYLLPIACKDKKIQPIQESLLDIVDKEIEK